MKLYAQFIDRAGIMSEPVNIEGFEVREVKNPDLVGPHIREGVYATIEGMPKNDHRKQTFEAAMVELLTRGNIGGVVITVGE